MGKVLLKKLVEKDLQKITPNYTIITEASIEEIKGIFDCDLRNLLKLKKEIFECLDDKERFFSILPIKGLVNFYLIISEELKNPDELSFEFNKEKRLITLYHQKKSRYHVRVF